MYENEGETLFEAQRPAVLNGIGNFITESDLLDRTIALELPTLDAANRRDEHQFWKDFREAQPKILGAVLDAVSCAMRNIEFVADRSDWPRLMDFGKWVTAAEPQLKWKPGAFMEAYNTNRAEANARVVDDDQVAIAITQLSAAGDWSGTASQLLATINPSGERGYPTAANKLKQRLVELKPNLAATGVPVEFCRQGSASNKIICIRKRVPQVAA